jgi:hypothetical protein
MNGGAGSQCEAGYVCSSEQHEAEHARMAKGVSQTPRPVCGDIKSRDTTRCVALPTQTRRPKSCHFPFFFARGEFCIFAFLYFHFPQRQQAD